MKTNISLAGYKRLKETHTAAQLDTNGCLLLIETICHDAAIEYNNCRFVLNRNPNDRDARHHYDLCRRFFLSRYFANLTELDGKEVLAQLDEKEPLEYVTV